MFPSQGPVTREAYTQAGNRSRAGDGQRRDRVTDRGAGGVCVNAGLGGLCRRRAPASAGECSPFDQVYTAHADSVFAFCWSQVGNHSDAEDLAADVFASAFAAYSVAGPEPGNVRAW